MLAELLSDRRPDLVYMELEVPLDRFIWDGKEDFRDALIETWRRVDEDPSVDPVDTSYYEYLTTSDAMKNCKADPTFRVDTKIALYQKIKKGGYCPCVPTRMTCNLSGDKFRVRNGHHRLSMIEHWGAPDPLIVLLWIPDKDGKTDVYV